MEYILSRIVEDSSRLSKCLNDGSIFCEAEFEETPHILASMDALIEVAFSKVLIETESPQTLKVCGQFFLDRKDLQSALHACKRAKSFLPHDVDFSEIIKEVTSKNEG